MKKALLIASAIACLAALPAYAQLSPFNGWRLGLNMNHAATVTTVAQFGGSDITSSMGDTDATPRLQAAYSMSLGTRYLLGMGLTLGLGGLQTTNLNPGGSEPSFRPRNMYSLYAEPAFTLSDSTLLYGKLAYLGGRATELSGSEVFGKSYAGLGLGAGLRTQLRDRLYLQVELLYGDYEWNSSRTDALHPVSTTGSIGLGWRF